MAADCALRDHDYCRPSLPDVGDFGLSDLDFADLLPQIDLDDKVALQQEFGWIDELLGPETQFSSLPGADQSEKFATEDFDDGYNSGASPLSAGSVPSPSKSDSGCTSVSSHSGSSSECLNDMPELDSRLLNDLSALSSLDSLLNVPRLPETSFAASQGCATSVLMGSGCPPATQPAPSSSGAAYPAPAPRSAEANKEQADPRLSGPTSFMANSVCWQYGQLNLTSEEKSVLKAEGLPIPTSLPLTPDEEKAIKQVRRKIKNKISAQESRRKRKQYIDTLEEQLSASAKMNQELLERVALLEKKNTSLEAETRALKKEVSVAKLPQGKQSHISMMVLVLAFAVVLPFWTTPMFSTSVTKSALPSTAPPPYVEPNIPQVSVNDQPFDYTTTRFRSRTLLSIMEPTPAGQCTWPNQSDWQPRLDEYLLSADVLSFQRLLVANLSTIPSDNDTLHVTITTTLRSSSPPASNQTWKQTFIS